MHYHKVVLVKFDQKLFTYGFVLSIVKATDNSIIREVGRSSFERIQDKKFFGYNKASDSYETINTSDLWLLIPEFVIDIYPVDIVRRVEKEYWATDKFD